MEDFKVESMEELQYIVLNKPIEYVMLIPDYLRCTKKNIMELNKSIIKNHKKQLIEVNKEYFKRAILDNLELRKYSMDIQEDKSYRIQNIYSSEEDQEYFKFTVKKVEAIRYKDLPQHLRTRELEQYYKRVSIEKNYKEFSNKDRVYLINLSWE